MNTNWFNPSPRPNPFANVQFNWKSAFGDEQPETPDYAQRMEELMRRPRPAMQNYLSFMEGMPQRENFQGGKLNTIAAVLTGLGSGLKGDPDAYSKAQAVKEMPYRRAYEDWANRGSAAKFAAENENNLAGEEMKNLQALQKFGIDKQTADAATNRAKTYQDWVDELGKGSWDTVNFGGKTYQQNSKSGELRPQGISEGELSRRSNESMASASRAQRALLFNKDQNFRRTENEMDRMTRLITGSNRTTKKQLTANEVAARRGVTLERMYELQDDLKDYIKPPDNKTTYWRLEFPAGTTQTQKDKINKRIDDKTKELFQLGAFDSPNNPDENETFSTIPQADWFNNDGGDWYGG